MFRLNQRAFEILRAEILRCTSDDPAGQVQRTIVLRRLEKYCAQSGSPLEFEELRDSLDDVFPNFSEQVLQAAARANRPPNAIWGHLQVATIALASLAGGIWFLNLPYPMIRQPVARVAPIVLLPSFMSMDHNYRQATALVEQSDQLVNQATSAADLELGATKVKAAQTHLDALPVWFLGYYPQFYCVWFQCGWRFTLDEFQQARKDIARMDAKVFQEKNAQTQLGEAEQALGSAKQHYQEAPNQAEKSTAISQWQQAIDTLGQIPKETLAGRMAQTKLVAYQRDFQEEVGFIAGNTRSGNLIQAARGFAETAQRSAQGDAHSAATWEEIQKQWQDAIDRLEKIDVTDPDYQPAQKLLAVYQKNQADARIRLAEEKVAVAAYENAQDQTERLIEQAASMTPAQLASRLQAIENQLSKVKPRTTVYKESITLRQQAAAKRKQYQR